MAVKRMSLMIAAAIFALALSVYIFSHNLMRSLFGSAKLSSAECTDTSTSQATTNPNKMLFISCGGYLD